MARQPGLFTPKFEGTSSHVFTQSPQNFAVEPGIHSLVCCDRCFALPQLLYGWRHLSGIFRMPTRRPNLGCCSVEKIHVDCNFFFMLRVPFKRVEVCEYLEATLKSQNCIQEEIKSRFKSGNVWYHSVQCLLFSCLLHKNLKNKIYRTVILPIVFMGVKLGR
jgi:hypothetical protein